jgi:cellulose synthase/poly-beta-1,6-N-acetylglucosamine synthase-like glycosyltransferase
MRCSVTLHDINLFVYNLALVPVIFFSSLFIFLALLNIAIDRERSRKAKLDFFPFVTIQVPSFNDPVAERCVDACRKFRYPQDRFEIMILDDSTDERISSRLARYAGRHRNVRFVHRETREGYKPGALKDAMHLVRGEIIVLFDADFVPAPDFLERVVPPFKDPKVAIVQGRQGFSNAKKNLIARFARYLLLVHHLIIMPINNKMNTVFFCGTAGAIRKSAIEAAGGWNTKSITEDSDLSVKILAKGYRTVYLPFETPSEVPITLEAFIKQQMRWCFGGIRVFFDHKKELFGGGRLTIRQRLMITYLTLGNLIAPVVILMTVAGFLGWVSGDLRLFGVPDVIDFFLKFFYTAGFLIMGALALYKRRELTEFPHLLLAAFSVSLVLSVANTVAVYKAVFRKDQPLFAKKTSWICTPKTGNEKF